MSAKQLIPNARRHNRIQMARLRLKQRLEPESIDVSRFSADQLAPGELDLLKFMFDVEVSTKLYFQNLSQNRWSVLHRRNRLFLAKWHHEEVRHSRRINRLLTAAGHGRQELPDPEPVQYSRIQHAWRRLSAIVTFLPVGMIMIAAHMAWGAINEAHARCAYHLLATQTESQALQKVLSENAKDEVRHGDYYGSEAAHWLRFRIVRYFVRRILVNRWSYVGVDENDDRFKTLREFLDANVILTRNQHFEDVLLEADRRIDQIPGLANLHFSRRIINDLRNHQELVSA